jgi:SET domain-containing protein
MNQYIDCSKVYIDDSEYGLGVFCKEDVKKGEILENGIMTILNNVDGHDNPHLFTWSEDKKTWATASGCLSFYNHSDNPNIKKVGDLKNNTIKVVALDNIKKNTELRNCYLSKKWRKCFKNM